MYLALGHRDRDLRRGRARRLRHAHRRRRSSPPAARRSRSPPSPTLGRAGYWLMSVTALFATAGATNAGLYPAAGLCEQMADDRPVPAAARPPVRRPRAGRTAAHRGDRDRARRRVRPERDRLDRQRHRPARVHAGHRGPLPGAPRDRSPPVDARASRSPAPVVVLVTFAFTTLVDEPATAVALVVILLLSVALDLGWKHVRDDRQPSH